MALAVCVLGFIVYVSWLDIQIRERFEGRLWALPSKVYARPLVLYQGLLMRADNLERELHAMRYEKVSQFPQKPGEYRRWQDTFELISREFDDGFGAEASHSVRLVIANNQVQQIEHLFSNESIERIRLDPALIASIYPHQAEDRLLLNLDEVPDRIIKTLLAVEDRSFFEHAGINPLAIARALYVNLRSGQHLQGGSTLTQQLVKNMFLSSERSYWRKINEAIMSLLIEWHYPKHSILEAYLNEVYLGQSNQSAIHGFELASNFYFNKDLQQLSAEEIALLIGMVKGPSYYNPWRHPQRALQRRMVVLEVMRDQGVISDVYFEQVVRRPLGIVANPVFSVQQHPAFVGLVKRQLSEQFKPEDLTQQGLKIYTTLDPQVQYNSEQSVRKVMATFTANASLQELQTAVVVTDVQTAAVLAMVGDRAPEFNGFNRAVDAYRQIGSLIKPAIYLAALRSSPETNLATLLSDRPLTLQMRDGQIWEPQNYDHQFRGDVMLFDALVNSYNVPSVRLGLGIGLPVIAKTLHDLGLQKEVPVYPSMLLGAFELSPLEVSQLYQTIAANGNYSELQTIRTVLSQQGVPLVRNLKASEQVISSRDMYLLRYTMHQITKTGTAASLANFPVSVAGKTGTTDDLRDSWFAGFSADKLGVVWMGHDDNQPTGLTGASGALRVWRQLFDAMPLHDLDLRPPQGVEMIEVDRANGLRARFLCDNKVDLPFFENARPVEYSDCRH